LYNEAILEDTAYVILELSLHTSKGQLEDTVRKSMNLHLMSPDNCPEVPIDKYKGYLYIKKGKMITPSQKRIDYVR